MIEEYDFRFEEFPKIILPAGSGLSERQTNIAAVAFIIGIVCIYKM